MKLADKIYNCLIKSNNGNTMDLWSIANHIYDNCMLISKPGNGIKIANIRMQSEKDPRLIYFVSHDGIQMVSISTEC